MGGCDKKGHPNPITPRIRAGSLIKVCCYCGFSIYYACSICFCKLFFSVIAYPSSAQIRVPTNLLWEKSPFFLAFFPWIAQSKIAFLMVGKI